MSLRSTLSRRFAILGGAAAAVAAVTERSAAQTPRTTSPPAAAATGMTPPHPVVSGPLLPGTAAAAAVPTEGADVIEILENDHKNIMQHLTTLQTGDVSTRDATLKSLILLFSVHNSTEENFVYPAVGGLAKRPGDQTALYHQQDEAKVVTWMLDTMAKDDPKFSTLVSQLTDAVRKHVAMEEQVDFPAVKNALGPAGTAAVTAKVRTFRSDFA